MALGVGASVGMAVASAQATCIELPSFACEIVPTYGDCKSPEGDVWDLDTPFTYRIGCEGEGIQSPDLLLDGRVLKAMPEPLRKCDQWSLWVLEEPLPAGRALSLSAVGTPKPLALSLTLREGAAKLARVPREPKRDFVCSVPPGSPPPPVVAPSPAGCGSCAASAGGRPMSWVWLTVAALLVRRARRAPFRRPRA